ncbi:MULTISPECIES: cytochrome C oxidase subunit IV family protein [Sphingobium]|uniref:cytochrome C oxidase subunit IV family protein n=1 Tax=Sphingobium sp. MI1205 TaxID=407020 RepID=UPI0007703B57|nr:cytochrome C oxidase subunit IV family protein [Sphingobium sp. MI1205]AMK19839.1 hypothetical protein K663_17391 [Sphingobium sp. MI1205]
MKHVIQSPVTIWAILVVATLASYLFQLEAMKFDPRIVGSAILVIAFFKVRLIGLRYMEIDEAILPLRLAFEAWVFAVAIALLTLFWIAG